MRKRVTLKDIAKRLDISHATVSRALNGKPDPMISEATRRRVVQAAKEIGYRPNSAARSLATGRTGLISLWLWSEGAQDSYQAAVSQRFHKEAISRSYQLLVDHVGWYLLQDPRQGHFDAWNVDGIIAHESGPAITSQFSLNSRPPVPIVSTGAYHMLDSVDQVFVDLRDGAEAAVKHLIATGRRRIAYMTDKLGDRGQDARTGAYRRLLEEAGIPHEFIETGSSRAETRARIREYVKELGCPDAIMCHHDDFAIATYRGLCDLGVRVPDDTALVGCNGIEDCEYLEVPISTIAQPFDELCSYATRFLEDRIEDPSRPLQTVVLKAEFIARESSGSLRKPKLPPFGEVPH
jgi:LacI family transcriptional regulator